MLKEKLKLLLVEDDLNLGVLLMDYLEREGFLVKLCRDGVQAQEVLGMQSFDLCLLDVMMPRMDGFTLAKHVKTNFPKLPIIFITAKSLKEDKKKGYDIGADDYITKPFDEEELLWKIKALLRRIPALSYNKPKKAVQIGTFTFDQSRQLIIHEQTPRRITEKESELLFYLYENRNVLIKRENLLKELWGENDYFLGRSLDVFISKLRKYLKDDVDVSIENVFGVGFIFNVPN